MAQQLKVPAALARESGFNSQHSYVSLQLFLTLVGGNLIPSSGLLKNGMHVHRHTCNQNNT